MKNYSKDYMEHLIRNMSRGYPLVRNSQIAALSKETFVLVYTSPELRMNDDMRQGLCGKFVESYDDLIRRKQEGRYGIDSETHEAVQNSLIKDVGLMQEAMKKLLTSPHAMISDDNRKKLQERLDAKN